MIPTDDFKRKGGEFEVEAYYGSKPPSCCLD